jgi:hypothetical protein
VKYFKLSRDDGVFWLTKKISSVLVKENLWSIERALRKCYYSNEWIEHNEHKYFLEKFKVENFDDIEFGKFNAEKEVVKRNIFDLDVFEIDEYDLKKTELIELLIKTKRQLQKRMDTQRIERKAWRMENRNTGIVEDTLSELLDKVEVFDSYKIKKQIKEDSDKIGILQLSDWHVGEVVDLEENKFNFRVAKERVSKYTEEVKEKLLKNNIKNIYALFLGDMLNLDSHRDKQLTNESVRAFALKELYSCVSMMIDDLLKEGFIINLAGVVGNESRIVSKEFMSSIDNIAIDSFDFILFMMLQARYDDCENVNFINNCDNIELVVNINGKNIYMAHGNFINHRKLEDEVASIKVRWFKKKKIMIDYCIFGHIHSTLITDNYARNASLVGANGFSDKVLNIHDSHASQNVGFVGEHIDIMSIKLD